MLQLMSYLTLALSSLSVLALPTDISLTDVSPTNILPSDISTAGTSTIPYTGTLTFTPLDKRAIDLPNNWQFILRSQPAIFEPIHVSAQAIIALYTAVIARASQVSAPPDHAASFKVGIFVLIFTGSPEDNRPLDWPIVMEFCRGMREKAHRGEPLLVEGWLVHRGTKQQIHVQLGFLKEIGGSP
ncbi:MAG: hypothetical protein LQ349_009593 [Xanthoria aureola]|nr:MAG: hypothetical protein LQ349_009593 [Xanthoria aureola]